MRFIVLPSMIVCLSLNACAMAPARMEHGGFVQRQAIVDGETHRYQVFVPAHAAGGRKPAVILFLHGSGERGSDGVKQTQAGLGPYLRTRMDDFPAIVVFPQAPADSEWSDSDGIAFAALDAALREFDGDPARVYLTGMSMGGYGTWELALRQPQRFAALVPVCGGITHPAHRPTLRVATVADAQDPFTATAARLHTIPIWIFHGARDDLVLPEQSQRMAAALEAAGAHDARYTEFPEANHNSWDPAYAHAPLWDWLFAQRRQTR